jgi:hypothetical protein
MQLIGMLDSPYVRRVAIVLIMPKFRLYIGQLRSFGTSTNSQSLTRT